MKAISLAFNHFDFIVNPFQATDVDREPTVIDNSVSISGESLSEFDHRFYFTLESQRAPKVKKCVCIHTNLWAHLGYRYYQSARR